MKAVFGQKREVGASVRLFQADFVRKRYQVDFKILSRKGQTFNLIAFREKVFGAYVSVVEFVGTDDFSQ